MGLGDTVIDLYHNYHIVKEILNKFIIDEISPTTANGNQSSGFLVTSGREGSVYRKDVPALAICPDGFGLVATKDVKINNSKLIPVETFIFVKLEDEVISAIKAVGQANALLNAKAWDYLDLIREGDEKGRSKYGMGAASLNYGICCASNFEELNDEDAAKEYSIIYAKEKSDASKEPILSLTHLLDSSMIVQTSQQKKTVTALKKICSTKLENPVSGGIEIFPQLFSFGTVQEDEEAVNEVIEKYFTTLTRQLGVYSDVIELILEMYPEKMQIDEADLSKYEFSISGEEDGSGKAYPESHFDYYKAVLNIATQKLTGSDEEKINILKDEIQIEIAENPKSNTLSEAFEALELFYNGNKNNRKAEYMLPNYKAPRTELPKELVEWGLIQKLVTIYTLPPSQIKRGEKNYVAWNKEFNDKLRDLKNPESDASFSIEQYPYHFANFLLQCAYRLPNENAWETYNIGADEQVIELFRGVGLPKSLAAGSIEILREKGGKFTFKQHASTSSSSATALFFMEFPYKGNSDTDNYEAFLITLKIPRNSSSSLTINPYTVTKRTLKDNEVLISPSAIFQVKEISGSMKTRKGIVYQKITCEQIDTKDDGINEVFSNVSKNKRAYISG